MHIAFRLLYLYGTPHRPPWASPPNEPQRLNAVPCGEGTVLNSIFEFHWVSMIGQFSVSLYRVYPFAERTATTKKKYVWELATEHVV